MAMLSGRKQLLFWIPAIFVAVALMIAIYLDIRPRPSRTSQYLVGNPVRGAELFYGEKQCGICHSIKVPADALPLTSPAAAQLRLRWAGWCRCCGTMAPACGGKFATPSSLIRNWNRRRWPTCLPSCTRRAMLTTPATSRAGEKVFTEKGCSRCHAVGAEGARKAPELSAVAAGGDPDVWTVAMLNHAGSMVTPITQTSWRVAQVNRC